MYRYKINYLWSNAKITHKRDISLATEGDAFFTEDGHILKAAENDFIEYVDERLY